MTSELDAFRAVNFDWTRQLKSVWRDSHYHVPSMHRQAVDDIVDYFVLKTVDPDPDDEPLGRVIVGPKGFGKTPLIGELRRQIWEREDWFVLLDFIGIKDFWSSVALGFLNSLQVRMADGTTQYDRLVLRIAKLLGIDEKLTTTAEQWRGEPRDLMLELVRLFTRSLARKYPGEANQHLDVVTALVLLISEDLDCHSIAHGWLQGMSFDGEDVRALGFKEDNSPIKVVRGLSWIMSRTAPTLIAVDQIDAIVTASKWPSLGGCDVGSKRARTTAPVRRAARRQKRRSQVRFRPRRENVIVTVDTPSRAAAALRVTRSSSRGIGGEFICRKDMCNAGQAGYGVLEQVQPLAAQRSEIVRESGHVAAGSRYVADRTS
jgi:hypothetical protein